MSRDQYFEENILTMWDKSIQKFIACIYHVFQALKNKQIKQIVVGMRSYHNFMYE